ncbi:MAG: isoleucine--tRNA ligase [Cytophagales bacterium]|nr:isoleucine--tRNA ligase [Cytophagales bacterium]
MKYREYKELNYARIAADVLAFWKDQQIFEQSVTSREGNPTFTFYEGPPSANGTPGIHHVMARTIKDIFCRYKTLQGYQVKRKGGWDTHGLPIELQVEKELGITKEDIGNKISIEEYNRKCREAVMKFTDQWNELTEKMGYWVDLDNPYVTYKTEYIETLWYLLRQLYDKGLLYKGYTIQPYSPSDGTGLSSHELNQPGCYKEVKDTSVVAQFKVTRNTKSEKLFDGNENVYILAWTTTPWTLPANSALTVGKNIEYVKIKTYNPYTFQPVSVILAKVLAGKYFSEKARDLSLSDYKPGDKLIPWKITAEYKGGDLEGVEYEQLLPYVQPPSPAFRVILGDFVTTEDGTGVVHTSPTFGADDFRVAQQNNIPSILVKDENGKEVPVVDKRGKFVAEIGAKLVEGVANYHIKTHKLLGADDFYVKNYTDEDESNPDYKNTDVIISIILKEENKAFKVEKYEHTYPHSWRTDKPVLYYPLDAWFIRTTAVKDKLVELNQTINWKPESTGTGRFGNWLENLVDWNLSRSRFWGTPLPIWRTEDGVEELCVGSLAELKEKLLEAVAHGKGILTAEQIDSNHRMIGNISDGKADLHRPYVDDIVLLSTDKRPMLREPDLIDVWFDSGAMPYAQWHWPFEGKETFEKSFPADFISEGVDQTRGWFFTLHAIAGMLFDDVAFKNVVSTGLVLDKNGEKMSKRKGNVINPFDTLNKYGPDATRWYMVVNAPPWDNLRFNLDGITEVQRKFFGTLFNTYQFYALYANLDTFRVEAQNTVPVAGRPEMDRWIISVLQTLIGEVETHYEDYEPTRATRAIQYFVTEQLSNWYVRLSRRRFWKGDLTDDKRSAYATLHECLLAVAQLMSPVAPFFGEWLYKNLADNSGGTASVHLTDWQPAQPALIDKDLEERMALAQQYSSLVHSLRKKHNIRVRQPLSRILIPVLNQAEKRKIEKVEALILSEVNIKKVEYIDDTSGLLVKKIKPNFKKLGKQFGPRMKDVAALITALDQDGIRALEKNGFLQTRLGEEPLTITIEDVEISSEDIPGWIVAAENGLTVALDTTISDDLRKEGIARDVVNRVQNLRKDMGLEVQDKIRIDVQRTDELVNAALEANREYICTETQALELNLKSHVENAQAVDLDDFVLNLKIQSVSV